MQLSGDFSLIFPGVPEGKPDLRWTIVTPDPDAKITLLKNDGILPLVDDGIGSVAVVGPLSDAVYRDWYTGAAADPTSPLDALVGRLGTNRVLACDGSDLVALGASDGRSGELYRRTDWGWGTQTFQALAKGNFVTADEGVVELVHSGLRGAVAAARNAETALIFVGNHPLTYGRATEEGAAPDLAPDQIRLIRAVSRTTPRTVVIVVGPYPFTIGDWEAGVSAVVYTAYDGPASSNLLTALLWGESTPGVPSPFTVGSSSTDRHTTLAFQGPS